ncbi:MAG: orotidine-5'-phosphate decarboxylase [Phycisphaerales bacterium]|nr:orotidine-5'-phosphate decarboxylase [Phycisphaerales bacterium]
MHASDRLLAAIDRIGAPVCVGLDPVVERLPTAVGSGIAPIERIERYCSDLLDALSGTVPCVKPQSACFERFGHQGVAVLERIVARSRALGLEVVLDAKRGDIGISAEHYAEAAFGHAAAADWITVNGYLGEDGIRPFLRPERGAFVLVRTSNPGGDALQQEALADGRTIAQAMADLVATIGAGRIGQRGYSDLGAVVGATKRQDAVELRRRMPQQILLVPGYGAQGGSLDDALVCFNRDGQGAIVTASRSVIYAFERDDPRWQDAVHAAAAAFRDEVGGAVSRPCG